MTKLDDPLVPVAFEVFSRLGLKKATMADVAAAAGVSRQTVYNRFANKDEVLRATTDYIGTIQLEKMKEAWSTAETLSEKIEIFYHSAPVFWWDMICKAPDAEALIEGLYTAARAEMERKNTEWRAALTEMLHPYSNHLGLKDTSALELADFLYSSASTAKSDAKDRDHLLRRLKTLKQAVLALAEDPPHA